MLGFNNGFSYLVGITEDICGDLLCYSIGVYKRETTLSKNIKLDVEDGNKIIFLDKRFRDNKYYRCTWFMKNGDKRHLLFNDNLIKLL